MKREWWLGAVVLIALAAIVYAYFTKQAPQQPIDCDLAAGCSFELRGGRVAVKTDAVPVAARPFQLDVVAPQANSVRAQFEMSGMNMTTPVYVLARKANGWRSEVVLPLCVSGRSDWMLRLEIDQQTVWIPAVITG